MGNVKLDRRSSFGREVGNVKEEQPNMVIVLFLFFENIKTYLLWKHIFSREI